MATVRAAPSVCARLQLTLHAELADVHDRFFGRRQQTINSNCAFSASRDNARPAFAGTSKTGATGLEPATSGVTGRRSNQLNYAPQGSRSVAEPRVKSAFVNRSRRD